jgi:hypothetical protein
MMKQRRRKWYQEDGEEGLNRSHCMDTKKDYSVRKLDAANSSSGSWDATRTQSQDKDLYVVRPILPTSTEHTRYITISL